MPSLILWSKVRIESMCDKYEVWDLKSLKQIFQLSPWPPFPHTIPTPPPTGLRLGPGNTGLESEDLSLLMTWALLLAQAYCVWLLLPSRHVLSQEAPQSLR